MKLCKDCKHYIPRKVMNAGIGGVHEIEARCGASDLVGDGYGRKTCVEERSTNNPATPGPCGYSGRNWEAA